MTGRGRARRTVGEGGKEDAEGGGQGGRLGGEERMTRERGNPRVRKHDGEGETRMTAGGGGKEDAEGGGAVTDRD